MRRTAHLIKTSVSVAALVGCLGMTAPITAMAADAATIEKGKKVAFDRKKGNCLACHQIEGGSLAGNIGPPLVAMKARFPDYEKMIDNTIGDMFWITYRYGKSKHER